MKKEVKFAYFNRNLSLFFHRSKYAGLCGHSYWDLTVRVSGTKRSRLLGSGNTITSKKFFVKIEGGNHNNLEYVNPDLFWNSIDHFVNNLNSY